MEYHRAESEFMKDFDKGIKEFFYLEGGLALMGALAGGIGGYFSVQDHTIFATTFGAVGGALAVPMLVTAGFCKLLDLADSRPKTKKSTLENKIKND